MRDYLFHAYNVTTKAIRSYVPPVRVERRLRLSKPGQRRRYRPQGIKKMTVQLEQPFVWPEGPDPEKPEEWRPWDRARYREQLGLPRDEVEEKAEKWEKKLEKTHVKSHESHEREGRSDLRRLAEEYLTGKKQWGNVDPSTILKSPGAPGLPHR